MIGIWNVTEIFHAGQILEVELRRVGYEELITTRIDDKLRQREPFAVFIRFLNLHQRAVFRRAVPVHDLCPGIIADGWCIEAVDLKVMSERRYDVKHVDD